MRRDQDRLSDIVEAAEAALRFVATRKRADLDSDELLLAGLVQKMVVIGEAASGVSEDFRDGHVGVPWAEMIGMRNVIVHGYWQVDPDELWRTVTVDLPTLLSEVRPLVDEES